MPLFTWRRAPIGRLNFISSESHVKTLGDVFSSSDLPCLGLVANHSLFCRYCHNCTLCPSANNWSHIWPSAPNFVESKTILRGWNSRFTSSGSFHMPLLCEISQTQVPARNFPAHLKKGPISEVLSKCWRRVFKFESPVLRIDWKSIMISQTLPHDNSDTPDARFPWNKEEVLFSLLFLICLSDTFWIFKIEAGLGSDIPNIKTSKTVPSDGTRSNYVSSIGHLSSLDARSRAVALWIISRK